MFINGDANAYRFFYCEQYFQYVYCMTTGGNNMGAATIRLNYVGGGI